MCTGLMRINAELDAVGDPYMQEVSACTTQHNKSHATHLLVLCQILLAYPIEQDRSHVLYAIAHAREAARQWASSSR